MRPAQVRYYFDADILGVGKLIAGLRPDCTYPGDPGATLHKRVRPACIIGSPATTDAEWLGPVEVRVAPGSRRAQRAGLGR